MLVSLVTKKGGAGKSNLAVNLAAALAGKSVKAAVIDADPQGTAVEHALKGLLPVEVHALPLESPRDLQRWLRTALAVRADYIVMDSPPHSGLVTQALLGITDLAIVPCQASGPDVVAAVATVEVIRQARANRADGGPACLLVPNRVDTRTVSGREIAEALAKVGEPVGPIIRQRVDFSDCWAAGRWVGDYAPGGDAHLDIMALAGAVKRKVWK